MVPQAVVIVTRGWAWTSPWLDINPKGVARDTESRDICCLWVEERNYMGKSAIFRNPA